MIPGQAMTRDRQIPSLASLLAGLVLCAAPLLALGQARPDDFKMPDDLTADFDKEVANFQAEMNLEQRAFLEESDREYQAFVKEVEGLWGNFVPSTRPTWSSYSADDRGHGEVDFDTGTVKVEVLLDGTGPVQKKEVEQKVQEQLGAMMSARNPAKRNPLSEIVDRGDGKPLQEADVPKVVKEKVEKAKLETRTVVANGKKRTVVTVELKMVPNHLTKAAKPYKQLVQEASKQFSVDEALILAVMQRESFFNPLAKSGAPAYGLMQLVPKSGANDAWRHVHGKARVVPAEELYRPEVNVELGSAYLHLMQTAEFGAMKDPAARDLAAIAAYNCGPGNTKKALAAISGDRKVLPKDASAAKVREALLAKTPDETKEYVKKVSEFRTTWKQATVPEVKN